MVEIKNKIWMTLKNYYVPILLFIMATIAMLIIIQNDANNLPIDDSRIKLVMTLIYGAIIALVLKNVRERIYNKRGYYDWLYLLVPIVMVVVYYLVLDDINIGSNILQYFILCFLSAILFLVIPFLGRKEDSDYYSYRVIISLALTGFCYVLIIGGIFLTMGSIAVLFEIDIKGILYPEIGILILGGLMPTLFFSLIPSYEEERKQYPNFINKILIYIVFPILSIYTIVLYAYFIKILILLEWPVNVLGNLIIYYALISIVVLYFVNQMKDINRWCNNFIKLYPYLLILPMLMMVTTFLIRINQYGFTELRYYGLVCFGWVMIAIFILSKEHKVKYIPLTLAVLLFISICGPISAARVSKMSQESRLEHILRANNMIVDNKIIPNVNLGEKEKEEICNIIVYYIDMHSSNDIKLLPKGFDLNNMGEVFGYSCWIYLFGDEFLYERL